MSTIDYLKVAGDTLMGHLLLYSFFEKKLYIFLQEVSSFNNTGDCDTFLDKINIINNELTENIHSFKFNFLDKDTKDRINKFNDNLKLFIDELQICTDKIKSFANNPNCKNVKYTEETALLETLHYLLYKNDNTNERHKETFLNTCPGQLREDAEKLEEDIKKKLNHFINRVRLGLLLLVLLYIIYRLHIIPHLDEMNLTYLTNKT